MSRLVAGFCATCRDWPCKCRTPVNELSDGDEFKSTRLAVMAMRLFVALKGHVKGDGEGSPECEVCRELLVEAAREFQEMGIQTP